MRKPLLALFTLTILTIIFCACAKAYTRADYDNLADKTFYLLPVESTFNVPASITSWKAIEEKIGAAVVSGVKELDVQKVKESIEKRYGIIVDTTYFERSRTSSEDSIKYFRALKDANATGSKSIAAVLSSGYKGYLDTGLYTEVEETRKTRQCIIIGQDTTIDEREIKTIVKISFFVNDEAKGSTILGRTMIWSSPGSEDNFDMRSIDFQAIKDSLSRINEFKYKDYSGLGLSGGEFLYLDGSN